MSSERRTTRRANVDKRRRWLLALDPIFEGGRQGKRAHTWDVEDQLIAVALLGDVTIDLSRTKSSPAEIAISAYAIFRDVDVVLAQSDSVELWGGGLRGKLHNTLLPVPEERHTRVIRIHGHTVLGDVTVRRVVGPQ